MELQRLKGKIAIVTGGAMGIGKAIVNRLAEEGASLIVADLDVDRAEQTVREVRERNAEASAYKLDLLDLHSINAMVDFAVDQYKRIDILINNAGVVQNKPMLEVTEADWDYIIDVNQKGVVFSIQAVAKQLIAQIPEETKKQQKSERSWGKIVNFTSISGRRGRALQVHYAASKAAVISITQSAALSLAPYNINVNAVSPSVVKTAMWEKNVAEKSKIFGVNAEKESEEFIDKIPLRRAGTPEDMAGAVVFLCSTDADYITGQTLNVDGGFEMD